MGAISIQDDKKADSLFTGLRAWCIFELAVAGTFHKDWTFVCSNGAMVDKLGPVNGKRCDKALTSQMLSWKLKRAKTGDAPIPMKNKRDIDDYVQYSQCPPLSWEFRGLGKP